MNNTHFKTVSKSTFFRFLQDGIENGKVEWRMRKKTKHFFEISTSKKDKKEKT